MGLRWTTTATCMSARCRGPTGRKLSETSHGRISCARCTSSGRWYKKVHGIPCCCTARFQPPPCPLWVMWGRRLIGKSFLDVDAALVECGHVSGLFCAAVKPLAIMLCPDRPCLHYVSCPRQFLQTSNAVVVSWPHLLESLWL